MNKIYFVFLTLCISCLCSFLFLNKKDIDNLNNKIEQLGKDYQYLELEKDLINYELKEKKQDNEILKKDNNKLEKEINNLNNKIKELNKKINQLSYSNNNNNNKVNTNNSKSKTYRLTSFWNGDGYGTGGCTGSGKCEKDFQKNNKGWYTYQGKLVVATATPYLLNYGWSKVNGIEYHKYYETLTININGIDYQAIVLDSCGACMKKNIIDLFVSGKSSSITTTVTVR